MATELLTTVGAGTWTCPAGVTEITVECIGGGGGGGTGAGNPATGGGGGGGSYAKKTLTVVPSTGYSYSVGAGGALDNGFQTAAGTGGDTWFKSTSDCNAKGGIGGSWQNSNNADGGAGGPPAGGHVGDLTYYGGYGGQGSRAKGFGGGGGGAAGSTGEGGWGGTDWVLPSTQGSGGTAGIGTSPGGNGGAGGAGGAAGSAGSTYGGGGGGGYATSNTNRSGGLGAQGVIRISYTLPYPKLTNVSNFTAATTDTNVYQVGSNITYDTNSVYLMAVMCTGALSEGGITSALTWTNIGYIGDTTRMISVFTARASSSGITEKPSVRFSSNASGCAIRVYQITDCTNSGVSGTDAIRQVVTKVTTTAANPSITMDTLGSRASVLSFFIGSAAFSGSVESGWTEENDASWSTPTTGVYTMLRQDTTDNTPSFTAASNTYIGIAIEIRPAGYMFTGNFAVARFDANAFVSSSSINSTFTKRGQAFIPYTDGKLHSVKLKMHGPSTGTVRVALSNTTGTYGTDALPNTLLATSNSIDVSTIGGSSAATASYVEFEFPEDQQPTLTAGTAYFIAAEYFGTGQVNVVMDSNDGYNGNNGIYNGTTWSATGSDILFSVLVEPSPTTSASVSGTLEDAPAPTGSISANITIPAVTTSGTLVGSGVLVGASTSTTSSPAGYYLDVTSASVSYSTVVHGYGQTFIATETGPITTCRLYLKKFVSPTGNIEARLYSIGSGTIGVNAKPGTLLCTSDSISATILTSSLVDYTFTFSSSPTTITAGTAYCIVIYYSGADGSNGMNLAVNTTSGHYGNRVQMSNTGTFSEVAWDAIFEVNVFNPTATISGTLSAVAPIVSIPITSTATVSGALSAVSSISAVIQGSVTDTLIDSYSGSADTVVPIYGVRGDGQAFTASGTGQLSKVKFWLRRTGSPTGNAQVKLYTVTGTMGTNAKPSTLLATSNDVDVTGISTTAGWVEFTFSPYAITSGTGYAIAIHFTGGDASNYVGILGDNTSPSHAGNWVSDTGTGWSGQSGVDRLFEVYTGTSSMSTVSGTLLGTAGLMSASLAGVYYNTYNTATALSSAFGRLGNAQAFTASSAATVQSATFYLFRNGTPTGSLVYKLYAITGTFGSSARPTGAALATSESFDIAQLSTNPTYYTLAFPAGTNLTVGTNYAVAIELVGSTTDGSNFVYVGKNTGDFYPGNSAFSDGASYGSMSAADTFFSVRVASSNNASSTVSSTLIATGVIASNIAAVPATVSGVIKGTAPIVSVPITSTSTVSAIITGIAPIVTSITSTSTASGTMLASGAMATTITSTSDLTATSGVGSSPLVANISSTSTCGATIIGIASIASNNSAATSLLTATLRGTTLAATLVTSSASITGTVLLGTGTVTTSISSTATCGAIIRATGTLSSTIAATSTAGATGGTINPIVSAIVSGATVGGTIRADARGTTTIASTSTCSATIIATGRLVCTTSAAATVTPVIKGSCQAVTSITASSTFAGALSTINPITTSIASTSSASGVIKGTAVAITTISSTSTCGAVIKGDIGISTTISSITTATAVATANYYMFSNISSVSTCSAVRTAQASLSTNIHAAASIVPVIRAVVPVASTVSMSSSVIGVCIEKFNGTYVRVWDGSTWVEGKLKKWDGTIWKGAIARRWTINGWEDT